MPLYRFTAIGRDGRYITGEDTASDPQTIERRLKSRRLVATRIREAPRKAISRATLTALIDQLATLMENGITVDRALKIIAEDATHRKSAQIAGELRQAIKKGHPLSQALDSLGQTDPLLVPIIRAGEASGQMAATLSSLKAHYERKEKTRREITGSLIYPAVLILASLLSIIALGIFVIPTFKTLFEGGSGAPIPTATALVFALSDVLAAHGPEIAGIIIIFAGTLIISYRKNFYVKRFLDYFVIKFPIVGPFVGKTEAANVTNVLGVLLSNGVSLAPALELALTTARNRAVRAGLQESLAAVLRGRAFKSALDSVPAFPSLARRLLAVGEETGRLDQAATNVGNKLGEEIQNRINMIVRVIEPAVILVMGMVIGFVVVSMLLAVYSLTDF